MMFPQLYTMTSYSLLSSTIRIEEYVKLGKKLGYKSLAIADLNVLYGAIEFYEACQKEHIQAIIGMTLEYTIADTEQVAQLVLYAKNLAGYKNLMQLSSAKMTHSTTFTLEEVKAFCSDLFAIMPIDQGEISLAFEQKQPDIEKSVQQLRSYFDQDSFFVGTSTDSSPATNHPLFHFFEMNNLPLVAWQKVCYLRSEEGFALEVLTHIADGTQTSIHLSAEGIKKDGTAFLLSESKVKEQLSVSSGQKALANAESIATNSQLTIPFHQRLLPHYPIENNQNAEAYLERLCWEKLSIRIPNCTNDYKERLRKELMIIHEMGFDDYFLIVWDVMDYAHSKKIVTGAGRGSAAGSLVSYVLSITDVDPIKYDLLFERFLNPERRSMPDIDLDIPDNRREEILIYVREKYGYHHMAQIATFGTMAAKQVLRDVARVFGLSQSESNRWSQAVPNALKMTLKKAYQESKKLVELVQLNEMNRLLFETAIHLEGLPRHVSTHAAGVVISDKNLLELVPLQSGSNNILLTQFTMNDVEKIGLLKMDFLGLRNLSIIDHTLQSIRRVDQKTIVLNQIPFNDVKTLRLFQKGETSGVFQFESAGIRNVLRKLGPTSIEDIAAVNALYRPGPMQNIDLFIRRKKGREAISYPDPILEPILKNTYGIIVYQEQIMQVASEMAGFSLGQADILRRAVSKKKKDVLDEERTHFIEGALAQGHKEENATIIYDYIERFVNYGFNRSHAFAYSFIGFQMAYLKVHYPAAFYTALLHSVRHNSNKIKEYIGEARKNKQAIIAPSINKSHYSFYLSDQNQIMFGFSSLKGIRKDFIQYIIDERNNRGPYRTFDQFLLRLSGKWLKKENIEPLIVIGAFDEFSPNRRQLVDDLDGKIQNIVYSGGSEDLFKTLELKEVEVLDYTLEEKLELEEQYLGVYLSGHPTEKFTKTRLMKQPTLISDSTEGNQVRLLVYVKEVRVIRTKKGEQMAFVEVDDLTGSLSLTVFPTIFRTLRNTIEKNCVYYAEGKIEKSNYNQALQLLVEQMTLANELEQAISDSTCYLKIPAVENEASLLKEVYETIQRNKGLIPVVLYYESNKKKLVLGEENWVEYSDTIQKQLQGILGEQNVVFK